MNYFELYELPVSFNIDAGMLKKKFYELSKRYHPDFYATESDEKQQEILELSTQVNKAYTTLLDQQKRMAYVLSLFQLLEEGQKQSLPQSFLMEMMDINEALMELEFDAGAKDVLEKLEVQVKAIETNIVGGLAAQFLAFDTSAADDRENILLKIRDIWHKKKYLLRIRDTLNMFATR